MCTLSWLTEAEGYGLWFNRDELNTRALELPPEERRTADGVTWLAPTDPDSGGTWLMANAHGVTCALLNRYPVDMVAVPPTEGRERPSRGRLVPLTAGVRSAFQAIETIRGERLADTPGFHVVAMDSSGEIHELRWDGVAGHLASGNEVVPPIASSSVRAKEVAAARRSTFPPEPSVASLDAYHHAHDPADGALSVNMCRSDASTRSICRVRVSAEWVTMDYAPQAWWLEAPAPPSRHRLTRLRPASLAK